MGYQSASCQFYLKSDTVIHVELQPMLNLDEIVVVQPNIPGWVKNSQPGQLEFPILVATVIPKLLGESDLLKAGSVISRRASWHGRNSGNTGPRGQSG